MTGYVCIAMLVDPPYNIFLSSTLEKPDDWVVNLPIPCHLLYYDQFDDSKDIENQCLTKLKEKGIEAHSNKAFSANPYFVIQTFMMVKDTFKHNLIGNTANIQSNNKSGPFGLFMGMSLDQITNDYELISNGIYSIKTVPKPHSEFDYYIVRISPTYGLYWIKAIGKDIYTSSYGYELKGKFETITEKLKTAYGNTKIHDFLYHGSIWNQPNDYMTALCKKEQSLHAMWEKADLNDKNNLTSVFIGAIGTDSNSGYIFIEYSFSNLALAELELSALEDDAL